MKKVLDRELMISFIGLASLFLAITFPLLLSSEWITVSWSVQALVLLWIAGKIESRFLRQTSYLLYFIVLFRFALFDLPSHYGRNMIDADLSLSVYLSMLLERLAIFGVPVLSLGGAWYLLKSQQAIGDDQETPENDVPEVLPRVGMMSCFWLPCLALYCSSCISNLMRQSVIYSHRCDCHHSLYCGLSPVVRYCGIIDEPPARQH